jgi:hypothetical protein
MPGSAALIDEADAIGQHAVALARKLDDTDLLADVVSMLTLALWGQPGSAAECLGLADEVLDRGASPERRLYARFARVNAYRQLGSTADADREIDGFASLARHLRHTGAEAPISWWQFTRAVDSGDAG